MTIEKAIEQLGDLIKDRESFCHRYCGGDLEMYTRKDRSFDGSKVGYVTTLFCHGCAGALFDFSESEDGIPNAEKRLLESYGIKENEK